MEKKHKYRIKLLGRVGKVSGINSAGSSEKLVSKYKTLVFSNLKGQFCQVWYFWLKFVDGGKVSSTN